MNDDETIVFKWNVGVRALPRERMVTFTTNPPYSDEDKSWIRQLMSRNPNSLANKIRRGEFVSAWDEYETESDAFAGRKSTTSAQVADEFEAYRREREEAAERQAAEIERIKQIQIEKAEAERREREEAAMAKLEELDGYGSF